MTDNSELAHDILMEMIDIPTEIPPKGYLTFDEEDVDEEDSTIRFLESIIENDDVGISTKMDIANYLITKM